MGSISCCAACDWAYYFCVFPPVMAGIACLIFAGVPPVIITFLSWPDSYITDVPFSCISYGGPGLDAVPSLAGSHRTSTVIAKMARSLGVVMACNDDDSHKPRG